MVFKRGQHVIGTDEDCAKMLGANKVPLSAINDQITCNLCKGYFIDATTVIECLHTFCRSCIVKYLGTHKYCPVCDVLVHKTRPLTNIRPDKTMQDIVYKLVPRLHQDEMCRKRDFYLSHPKSTPSALEVKNELLYDYVLTPEDNVCVSLSYFQSTAVPRYLKCPAAVSVGHLQRLVAGKYELSETHHVDIYYNDDCLHSHLTLMEVAYIYSWRRTGPLELTYRIFENRAKRQKLNAEDASPMNNNNWKEVQLRISENGEISVTGIQENLPDEADDDFVVKDQKILSESVDKSSNVPRDPKSKTKLKASKKGEGKHSRRNHKNNSNGKSAHEDAKDSQDVLGKNAKFDERMEVDESSLLVGEDRCKSDKENGNNQKVSKRTENQNYLKRDTGQNLTDQGKSSVKNNLSVTESNLSESFQIHNSSANESSSEKIQSSSIEKVDVAPKPKSGRNQGKNTKTQSLDKNTKLKTIQNLHKTNENQRKTSKNQQRSKSDNLNNGNEISDGGENLEATDLNCKIRENFQTMGENLPKQNENVQKENRQKQKGTAKANETFDKGENLGSVAEHLDCLSGRNENISKADKNQPKSSNPTATSENLEKSESLPIRNDNLSKTGATKNVMASGRESENSSSNNTENLPKTNPGNENISRRNENLPKGGKNQQKATSESFDGPDLSGNSANHQRSENSPDKTSALIENSSKGNDNQQKTDGNENSGGESEKNQQKTKKSGQTTVDTAKSNCKGETPHCRNERRGESGKNQVSENKTVNLNSVNGKKDENHGDQEFKESEVTGGAANEIVTEINDRLKSSENNNEKSKTPKLSENSNTKDLEENKNIITTSIYPISGVKTTMSSSFNTSSSNKRKLDDKSEFEPPPKQPTILNHTLGLQNLSNNHPLKKHSMSIPQSNKWANKSSNPAPLCYTPRTTVYNPIINVPKPQTSSQKAETKAKDGKNTPATILNSKVPIKTKPGTPIGYKTLRDPPKSWNPQLPRPILNRGAAETKGVELKNVRPPKFFKIRNNMPRYLGNPASGVKPMYQVQTSPDKDKAEKSDKTENIKKHSIVKIDPKTLKPISERAPETSNLSRTTSEHADLKINTSSVSIFNPLKLQSSSPKSGDRKSPKSPNKILNFTPPNPFIPNLQSPTIPPNQFLFPGPFNSYDPRMMAAYHSFLYGQTRLPFVNHLTGINVEIGRKNYELQKMQQTATMPSTSATTTPVVTAASNKNNVASSKKAKDKNEKSLQNAVEKLTQNKLKEKENSQEKCANENVAGVQEVAAVKNGESKSDGNNEGPPKDNNTEVKSTSIAADSASNNSKLTENITSESNTNPNVTENK